jgi:uncharacterized protein
LTSNVFVATEMKVTYDERKRAWTLAERGLDFADAAKVFAGIHFSREDDKKDYGERRVISVGKLDADTVVIVWTPRPGSRRIISMRKASVKERQRYETELRRR